jgi:hypothetical protein
MSTLLPILHFVFNALCYECLSFKIFDLLNYFNVLSVEISLKQSAPREELN